MLEEDKRLEQEKQQVSDLKFNICAFIDLLGFSSHLEISSYDLRTTIGEQAIKRLETLEDGMELIRKEAKDLPEAVPKGLRIQRINDAIIFTLDLDDCLLPSIGQTRFTGISGKDLERNFDLVSFSDSTEFSSVYEARILKAIEPIKQFLGIVARLHLFVQNKEGNSFFPGARTIISTGFRRPFRALQDQDDALSANFAFSNVVVADKSLHGPHFYVDNNLIELCSKDRLARNLMRFSCFEWGESSYDCLRDEQPTEGITLGEAIKISDPKTLMLFRRRYLFRRLNPSPLSFLQHLIFLRPCIDGNEKADLSNPYFTHILDAVNYGVSDKRIDASKPPKSFLYTGTNDLETSIIEFKELLLTGDSPTRHFRRRRMWLENEGCPELVENKEFMTKMDGLDAEEVEMELEPLKIDIFGDAIWQISEESFTSLFPFVKGDFSKLMFPRD